MNKKDEIKKSSKANLESHRGTYFLMGVVVAAAVLFFAFEWSTDTRKLDETVLVQDVLAEEEIEITRREPTPPPPKPKEEEVTEEIFVVVEQQPEFPGGNAAMMKFLSDNIRYPVIAQENGIQGRVICNFVVERDGSITDVQVVRGVDPSLDREAVRVIQQMPRWAPGKQRGSAVRVRFTLPVVFRLQN